LVPDVAKAWTDRHNAPRIERYRRLGPADRDFDRRDTAGMDAYVGAALGIGATFGSTVLGTVMRGIENDSPRELLESLRRHCSEQEQILMRLPAWVPLPAGRYRLQTAGSESAIRVDGQARVASAGAPPIRFAKPGWHRIESSAQNRAAASLIRVQS